MPVATITKGSDGEIVCNRCKASRLSPVYRVSIAHAAALKEGLRLRDERDPGKRVYSIRTIIADRPTASLTLNCDRVNP